LSSTSSPHITQEQTKTKHVLQSVASNKDLAKIHLYTHDITKRLRHIMMPYEAQWVPSLPWESFLGLEPGNCDFTNDILHDRYRYRPKVIPKYRIVVTVCRGQIWINMGRFPAF
jgi:hypothetical protein